MVFRQGANAVFSDGDTFVTIPVGVTGTTLSFDDGARRLVLDSNGAMRVGNQTIDNVLRPVSAAPDKASAEPGEHASAIARLYFSEGGVAWVGGDMEVYGTNGSEQIGVQRGSITLDASFARGGDLLHLPTALANIAVQRSGSTIIFGSADSLFDVTLSAGKAGLTVDFANDTRTLAFDPLSGSIYLGAQALTGTSALMTFA
jgi:hypothetical protein